MNKITDFLTAQGNSYLDKISQSVKFALGAAATASLV